MRRSVESDGVEAAELLNELLTTMGLARSRSALPKTTSVATARKRAVIGLPADADHADERLAMLDILRECVRSIRLPRPELPTVEDYERERAVVVRTWNDALHARGLVTLTPLCDVCGTPVLLRGPDRGGELSTVCSARCRDTRKKRGRRTRRK